MSIKIDPIKIEIKDNYKFGLVAFLVDKENFLQDIHIARTELNLDQLLPHDEQDEWEEKQLEELKKIKPPTIIRTQNGIAYWDPETQLEKIVYRLLKKYRKSERYYKVISSSILSGIVIENDFSKTAYCYIRYPNFYNPADYGLNIVEEPEICIVITPDTKFEELEKLYRSEMPKLIKEFQDYSIGYDIQHKKTDTFSNIKRELNKS